jgi:hypothetical protein
MNPTSLEIDRLILIDLDMTRSQAERLRPLLAAELQVLVERDGLSETAAGTELRTIQAPTVQLRFGRTDPQLMSGLAQSISQTLCKLPRSGGN